MSTHEANGETIRQAVLAAIQNYDPDWQDVHVTWAGSGASSTFGSPDGVIELDVTSAVQEQEHTSATLDVSGNRVVTTRVVYRMQVDVFVKKTDDRKGQDVAGKLRTAFLRQDFRDALAPDVKVVGRIGPERKIYRNAKNRQEGEWMLELPIRYQVEYSGVTETQTTIGTVNAELNAADEFADVPVSATEE